MPGPLVNRAIVTASRRVPGVRRLPVLKLLAIAEVTVLARNHMIKLDRNERRRLVELVRLGHGRTRNLTPRERAELSALLTKIEPCLFVGTAANKLSPVPIPGRLLYGRARKRRP
jgi:hypothetical protein